MPIEVKAEENLRVKSLKSFCDKYQPEGAIRTSMSDFREQNWMTYVPLYCIGEAVIPELMDSLSSRSRFR